MGFFWYRIEASLIFAAFSMAGKPKIDVELERACFKLGNDAHIKRHGVVADFFKERAPDLDVLVIFSQHAIIL